MGKMTKSKELIIAVFIFVSVIITTVILAVCAVTERENEKKMQRQWAAENKIQSVIETKSIEYLQETGEEDAEIVTDSSMLTENTKDTMKEAVKEISCWGDSMMEGCGKGFAVINNNGLYKDIDFCLKKSGNNIIIQVKSGVKYICNDTIGNYEKWVISYTKDLRIPMMLYTAAINSIFFLIAAALIFTRNGVTSGFLLNLIFCIIITPVISLTLTKMIYQSENAMVVADALQRVQ